MIKKRIIWLIGFIAIVSLVFTAYFSYDLLSFSRRPALTNQTPIIYHLQSGRSVTTFAYDMHKQGYLKHPALFIWLARVQGKTRKLQAGEYEFPVGITAEQLLHKICSGHVVKHMQTFVEGWTFAQMRQAMAKNPYLTHDTTELTEQQIMAKLGKPNMPAEGLFLPETYQFKLNDSDFQILQKAQQNMQQYLQHAWQQRADNLPYTTPYQALIAASLIEKESALNSERPLIAGVLVSRLRAKMPLQFDPTIIYGLGQSYKGKLTSKNLKVDSPYNTYKHRGLPPTPIAMPSTQSIDAALHPMVRGYLYFVAKGDGSHDFSKTLVDHNKAVQRYKAFQAKQQQANMR